MNFSCNLFSLFENVLTANKKDSLSPPWKILSISSGYQAVFFFEKGARLEVHVWPHQMSWVFNTQNFIVSPYVDVH